MSIRTVLATITEPTGKAREGLVAFFYAPAGHAHVTASADAAGTIRPELETGIEYRVPVENAVVVDGVPFPAGTIIHIVVPEGEGPATAAEVLTGTTDASRPALLDHQAEAVAVMDDLLTRIGALDTMPDLSDLRARLAALLDSPLFGAGTMAGDGLGDLLDGEDG